MYGEGGNHLLAAIRRNIDITVLVHNNQIYGLTKGQASPTSDRGFKTKTQPEGVIPLPFNPLATAVAMHAGFVARSFVGIKEHLVDMIIEAMEHKGFSLVDILQPCVSFNRVNTFQWYKERCRELSSDYDPLDWKSATEKSDIWGDEIPVGVIYKNDRPSFEDNFSILKDGPLVGRDVNRSELAEIMQSYA